MCCGLCSILCPADRPSPIFLAYTVLLNLPPLVASIVIACTNWRNGCRHNLEILLVVLAAFHIYMIFFAARLQRRFNQPAELRKQQGGRNCWGDFSIILFFLVAPTAFIMSIVGFTWARGSRTYSCPRPLERAAVASGVLMIVYLCTMALAMLLNACVAILFPPRAPVQGAEGQASSSQPTYTPPTAAVAQHPDSSFHPPTLPPGVPPQGQPYDARYAAYHVPTHAAQPAHLMVSSMLYPQSWGGRLGHGEAAQQHLPAGGFPQSAGYGASSEEAFPEPVKPGKSGV